MPHFTWAEPYATLFHHFPSSMFLHAVSSWFFAPLLSIQTKKPIYWLQMTNLWLFLISIWFRSCMWSSGCLRSWLGLMMILLIKQISSGSTDHNNYHKYFSSFSLAEIPPCDLQITAYKICRQLFMVCSCAMSSNCVWLQTIFCFLRSLLRENGSFPKIFIKKANSVTEW